ncbi:MAG: Tagaturonate reductase, partial [Bacteroidota bacterium]
MERLNEQIYRTIADNDVQTVLDYPEKVLQFGTGVLLRALPDFFIDVANKQGKFKGRIVMVKSTPGQVDTAYEDQDNLFTHIIKGLDQGKLIDKMHINSSISRCLHAEDNWDE